MHEDAPHADTTPDSDHLRKRTRFRLVVIRFVRAVTGGPAENHEGKKPYCVGDGKHGPPTCNGCVWQ